MSPPPVNLSAGADGSSTTTWAEWIVEYAREGETAWLNRSCTGKGLAELMSKLIAEPALVVDMSRRVRDRRSELVTPMADHVEAIEAIYDEVCSAARA